MSRRVAALLTGLLSAGCSVVGVRSGTEEPKFDVVGHVGEIEIRTYGPRIAAETTIEADEQQARGEGFRRVAGYIFGANTTQTTIAMTAPVAQGAASETIAMTAPVATSRDASGRWVVRFFMPAKYTMQTLPVPTDTRVRLAVVPAETVGVLRFTGSTGTEAVATQRQALLTALAASNWQPVGTPVAWFYDPPWTIPFLRRNEVAVTVTPTHKVDG